MYEKLYPLLLR